MNLDAIFKAYDIRGVYPTELNEELVTNIGKAFAQFVHADTIIIGHDMRLSSPALVDACIEGITSVGKHVQLAGLIPTDASYYAAGKYNLPTLMFTASHNPPEYNGMKFTDAGAVPIGVESGLRDIRRILETEDWPGATESGTVTTVDILSEYVKHVLSMIDASSIKPLKIVIDAGNGMGGYVAPKVFERLPCTVVPLYFELDGTMPNHEPNPIDAKNVQDLIAAVKEHHADLGIAFDGDADRAFFIDETGGRVSSSAITAMIAKKLLQEHPGATMIYNVVCSRVVPETITANGGIAIQERVGHSYIKKTMKETGAIFAGEHSGHYYFLDNYRADSGMIAALIVIEMLSQANEPLSSLLHEFNTYYAIEETNSRVTDKAAAIARLKAAYSTATIHELDGITFTLPDCWFNVRPSNTEPVLRLNLEATTPQLRDTETKKVLGLIREGNV